jgi:hypothetical protein
MKQFKENFKPVEVELINLDGESFIIKSNFLKSEQSNEVQKLMRDESKTLVERCLESMVIYFGKDVKFYKQFSMEMLTDVALYMNELKSDKKKLEKSGV